MCGHSNLLIVLTFAVSSRAGRSGLSAESEGSLKAEFGDRFKLVSHLSVVIFSVTHFNYSTVSYYPLSYVSNSSTTNVYLTDNVIIRPGGKT